MRYRTLVLLPAIAVAAACTGKDRAPTSGANADLKRDLALASSPGMELANSSRANTQVVSAIERVASTAPKGRVKPHEKPNAPIAAPTPVESVADTPAPTVVAITPEPAPAPGPSAPEVMPTAGARPRAPVFGGGAMAGNGAGDHDGGWGGGSVVVRGGGVDGDHCDPRHGGMMGAGRIFRDAREARALLAPRF